MDALTYAFGTLVFLAVCTACLLAALLKKTPHMNEDRVESERAALETAAEIRDYLRPSIDGKVIVRATDFGGLQ